MNIMPDYIYAFEDFDGNYNGKWVFPIDDLPPDAPVSTIQGYIKLSIYNDLQQEVNELKIKLEMMGVSDD